MEKSVWISRGPAVACDVTHQYEWKYVRMGSALSFHFFALHDVCYSFFFFRLSISIIKNGIRCVRVRCVCECDMIWPLFLILLSYKIHYKSLCLCVFHSFRSFASIFVSLLYYQQDEYGGINFAESNTLTIFSSFQLTIQSHVMAGYTLTRCHSAVSSTNLLLTPAEVRLTKATATSWNLDYVALPMRIARTRDPFC